MLDGLASSPGGTLMPCSISLRSLPCTKGGYPATSEIHTSAAGAVPLLLAHNASLVREKRHKTRVLLLICATPTLSFGWDPPLNHRTRVIRRPPPTPHSPRPSLAGHPPPSSTVGDVPAVLHRR